MSTEFETKYKKYRIKQVGNKFYPQYYKLFWWHDFSKNIWYNDDWFNFTIKFDSLEEAKQFVKDRVKEQETKDEELLEKIKQLDLEPKYFKIED